MKLKQSIMAISGLLATQITAFSAEIPVTSDITSDTTWTSNNVYVLDKPIFVKSGAKLTIQPGTVIAGTEDPNTKSKGSLVITTEGMIDAVGTAANPIVFTAKQEIDGANLDPAKGDGGLWGGVILLGQAPINYYTGPTTNAGENIIEGFPSSTSRDIRYGGDQPNHNSGRLKYVSIRFGGYEFAPNKEINGLTLGGVGRGTQIENIEIVSNTDDGLEIFGGTVNTKRIAVAFCQDDSFDLDEGHQGFHQFWFAIQNADGTLGDRGGEWDGGNRTGTGVVTGAPFTSPRIFNATFVGDGSTTGGGNSGIFLDDNFAGQVFNSVFHDYSGEAVRNSGDGIGNPKPGFTNSTFGNFGGGYGVLDSVSKAGVSKVTDPGLTSISRTADGGLNPIPTAGSALRSAPRSPFPADAPKGFFETAPYRGAFGSANWLDGWSWLSQKGYLPKPPASLNPVFNLQPKSAIVAVGSVARLQANATAPTGPTTYQWFKNNVPLRGQTSNVLTIPSFKAASRGKFHVIATSGGLTTKSLVATLDVPKVTSRLTQLTLKTGVRKREQVRTNFNANRYIALGLPRGLTINNTGLISGTPTVKGRFPVTIRASRVVGGRTLLTTTARRVIIVR